MRFASDVRENFVLVDSGRLKVVSLMCTLSFRSAEVV
jgi:hypothetical protein